MTCSYIAYMKDRMQSKMACKFVHPDLARNVKTRFLSYPQKIYNTHTTFFILLRKIVNVNKITKRHYDSLTARLRIPEWSPLFHVDAYVHFSPRKRT